MYTWEYPCVQIILDPVEICKTNIEQGSIPAFWNVPSNRALKDNKVIQNHESKC